MVKWGGRAPPILSARLCAPVKGVDTWTLRNVRQGVYRTKQLYTKEELAARIALRTRAAGLRAAPVRCGWTRGSFGHAARANGPGPGHARAGDALPPHPGGGLRGPLPGRMPVKRNPGRAVSGHPRRRARRHAPRRREDRPWAAQVQKEKRPPLSSARSSSRSSSRASSPPKLPTKFFVAEGSAEELMDKCAPFCPRRTERRR